MGLAPGVVRGRHYTEYVDEVRSLRREGQEKEAQRLLLELVEATEAESRAQGQGWPVAPWYYEQLAISYRKCADLEGEIGILERYAQHARHLAVPSNPLVKRLMKARARAARAGEGKMNVRSGADAGFEPMLPKVTDYWDTNADACNVMAGHLAGLAGAARQQTLTALTAAVTAHVRVLEDTVLLEAAIPVADDLYKAANRIDRWDRDLHDYLEATAATFWSAFSQRGFTLRYVVDNTFRDLSRPLQLFPYWFLAAGLVYVSPQYAAAELILRTIGAEAPVTDLLPSRIREARDVVEQLLGECEEKGDNFILLDLDFDLSYIDRFAVRKDRTLTLFRNEAPEPGTKVKVVYPESLPEPPSAR
jgi:hypothetical protein